MRLYIENGLSKSVLILQKNFEFLEKQFCFVPLFSPIGRWSNTFNTKTDYIRKGG